MKYIIACTLVVLLSACGSTRMKDTWQSDSFSKSDLDKVLVVAVTTNQSARMLFEEGLALPLKEDGITTQTSYQVLGNTATREDVVAYVKSHDIRYVLVTKVDNVKINQDYVPESVVTYHTGSYYGYNYYWGDSVTMVREEYTDTQTIVMLVTTLFDVRTEAPVWVGHSETFEMNAVATAGVEVARAALRKMSR